MLRALHYTGAHLGAAHTGTLTVPSAAYARQMAHERLNGWMHRLEFSRHGSVRLGYGSEHWDPTADNYEGAVALRDRKRRAAKTRALRLQRPHGRVTKWEVASDLSGFLLSDVVLAAGGVELAVERLRLAKSRLEAIAAEHGYFGPNVSLADGASVEATYAFAELLVWVRSIEERLKRKPRGKLPRKQGLVPALRPKRLRKQVEAAASQFTTSAAGDCRLLANFSLHGALVRNPFSGVEIDEAGRARLPCPDVPTTPVAHWYLLTWTDGRDGFVVAEDAWASVQTLIDHLLTAFETHVPKRHRRQPAVAGS